MLSFSLVDLPSVGVVLRLEIWCNGTRFIDDSETITEIDIFMSISPACDSTKYSAAAVSNRESFLLTVVNHSC